MHTLEVMMGQAAIGNLTKVAIGTNNLMTCSAVLFYNASTRMGGVYHYPADALPKKDKFANDTKAMLTSIILQMKLRPTNSIIAFVPGSYSVKDFYNPGLSGNDSREDMEALGDFFESRGFRMKKLGACGTVRVLVKEHLFQMEKQIPAPSKSLSYLNGGIRGQDSAIILSAHGLGSGSGSLSVRVYGWDLWSKEEASQKAKKAEKKPPIVSRMSSTDSNDSEDLYEIMTPVKQGQFKQLKSWKGE